jgi:plasmid maintenance system killer protein
MELVRSIRFERSYAKAPRQVQRAFDKQSSLLLQNLHHPSLRAKKYDEGRNLWHARVNKSWRFYFLIQDDVYYIVDVVPHPK